MNRRLTLLLASVAAGASGCTVAAENAANSVENHEVTSAANAAPADSPGGDTGGSVEPAPRSGNDARDVPDDGAGPPPPPPVPPVVNTSIPTSLHGRWGLVAADCTSTRGDAKGLITVSADRIRFYESTARPVKVAERTDTVIQGDFAFSGEGQTWSKHMRWSRSGNKLSRFEGEGDTALTYTRC